MKEIAEVHHLKSENEKSFTPENERLGNESWSFGSDDFPLHMNDFQVLYINLPAWINFERLSFLKNNEIRIVCVCVCV